MKILLKGALVLKGKRKRRLDILVADAFIADLAPSIPPSQADVVFDASVLTLMPGFIDIHTHGALGIDFNHASAEEMEKVGSFYLQKGVTSYLPTILTDTTTVMLKQLELFGDPTLVKANPTIKGIHLEGPFLNVSYKGAMPKDLLRNPDVPLLLELFAASRNTIRILTISPELPGALAVIEAATDLGIRVSLGHSAATYEQTVSAFKAGAVGTTHIMNAMKLLHMHDPAILTAVLENNCYAEMICDGFHLHPPIVRLLLKIKGYGQMICVTDSISAAGCPDGIYRLGMNTVEVMGGDAKVVETSARAGSTLTMDKVLRNLVSYTATDIAHLSPLLSTNAARMLGLDGELGSIEVGKKADIVGLDGSLSVQLSMSEGTIRYKGVNNA